MVLIKEVAQKIINDQLINWRFEDGKIKKQMQFKNFDEAFDFISQMADVCKKHNHHPYWSNNYNIVNIELMTYDAGGVTMKDVNLANDIDNLPLT